MNKKSDDLKVQLAANIAAFDFEGDKNAIKIINRLGNLCEWRSKIFQAFAGSEEPGWKGWKQMPPTIFADLGKAYYIYGLRTLAVKTETSQLREGQLGAQSFRKIE